ncbi:hypothetical protein AAFN46_01160 [Pseudomonas sp. CAU 1711]|uniref:hypothetical protein n=1 Tax=Pseudomonas sp. CAU 1711 TaxID=3140356 RepID=UPI003260095D
MDKAQVLLQGLWEPFSFLSLLGYSCLGVLLGVVAGLLLALQLQRRGWLGRRKRWHHWLLKSYFLLLPAGGAFFGLQGGLLYGGQQQVYRHLDSYAPLVQTVADGLWQDFEAHLQAQDQQTLAKALQASSVQALLNQLAAQYLQAQMLARAPELEHASVSERIATGLLDLLQAAMLEELVRDSVAEQADKYAGVDRQVVLQVLDARVEQLFQADFLLGLLKRQIGQALKPFYLSLLLLVALLLAVIAAELLLSRRLQLWAGQPPRGVPAQAQSLARR